MAKPFARIVAIVETVETVNGESKKKTNWIEIGVLWQARDSDNLSGQIVSEPIQWGDPKFPRRIAIQYNAPGGEG